jgi:SAM-dependent methyltransferase
VTETPDPKLYAAAQFADPAGMDALGIIERYATDVPAGIQTLLDALRPEREAWRYLELGFGSGWLLRRVLEAYPGVQVHGLDMSASLVRAADQAFGAAVQIVRADMDHLPYTPSSFDCVTTCWTLYFMPDVDATLAEIARVLKPGSRLVAATVAPNHMREMTDFSRNVMDPFGGAFIDEVDRRFDTETGLAAVRRHFEGVELHEWGGEMVLDVPTFLRFWELFHPQELARRRGNQIRSRAEILAKNLAGASGRIRLTRHDGAFVGRKPGAPSDFRLVPGP